MTLEWGLLISSLSEVFQIGGIYVTSFIKLLYLPNSQLQWRHSLGVSLEV